MNCPNCGSPLNDGAKFCPMCGTPLAQTAAPAPAPAAAPAEQPAQPTSAQAQPVKPAQAAAPKAQPAPAQAQPQSQAGQQQAQTAQPQASQAQPNVVVNVQTAPGYAANGNYGNAYATNVAASMGAAPNSGEVEVNRNIVTYALLSFFTCGIYSYWFVYKLAQDANKVCGNDGENTSGLGAFILLSILTCGLYAYYWQYKLQNRLQLNAPRYGVIVQESGNVVLAWDLVPIVLALFFFWMPFIAVPIFFVSYVGMSILIKNMNKMGRAYNAANGYQVL